MTIPINYDAETMLEIPIEMYQYASANSLHVACVLIEGEDGCMFACLLGSIPRKGETILLEDGGLHIVEDVCFRVGRLDGYPFAHPVVIAHPAVPCQQPAA